VGWSGASCPGNVCTMTLDQNKNVTATFRQRSSGTLTGTWVGTFSRPAFGFCNNETFATTWRLQQNGNQVTGTYLRVVTSTDGDLCPDNPGDRFQGDLVQGTLNGNSLTIFESGGTRYDATVNGTTITGTGRTGAGSGPLNLRKQ
jgi:hypothetical protein